MLLSLAITLVFLSPLLVEAVVNLNDGMAKQAWPLSNSIFRPPIIEYEMRFAIKTLSFARERKDFGQALPKGVEAHFMLRKPYDAPYGYLDSSLDICSMEVGGSLWHTCTGPSRNASGIRDKTDQPWLKWRVTDLEESPKSVPGRPAEPPFRHISFELVLGRM
jgi:hypothetical protein